MLGKAVSLSLDETPIITGEYAVEDSKEKAEIFLDYFSSVFPSNIPTNIKFERLIKASNQGV